MRIARSFDEAAAGNAEADAFRRMATAVTKYYVTKRAPHVVAEAMEAHGGNGCGRAVALRGRGRVCDTGTRVPRARACTMRRYAEEWHMARLFRQVRVLRR